MSRWAIGDIHGAAKALDQVLEQIDPQPDDTIIFLGDYCDGYSETPRVIDTILGLDCNVVSIRGNHDQWMLEWMRRNCSRPDPGHLRNGGKSTIASYLDPDLKRIARHLKFLESTVNFYIDEDNNAFVHGGFFSGPGIDSPHECQWNRDMFEKFVFGGKRRAWLTPWHPSQHRRVFIGHTTTEQANYHWNLDRFAPIITDHVVALDTGCGWWGRLTAMNIDTFEYVQSDETSKLYPNEQGRSG